MFLTRRIVLLVMALFTTLSMAACTWTIERNEDGSWSVTGTITQAEVQDIIDDSLADPLISNLRTDFHPGYIDVTADRVNPDSGQVEPMSFRVTMFVVNDHLGVSVSDVVLAGQPINPTLVDTWNQRMATRLERAGQRNPNSKLLSVSITEDDLTMSWHVEGRRGASEG